MNRIHPQHSAFQKKEKKKKESVRRPSDRRPFVLGIFSRAYRRLSTQDDRAGGDPLHPNVEEALPVGRAGRANPANKWPRRPQISIVHLCWIYLYKAPAGNAPVKAYGDTFHARHGTFTSSMFQAAPASFGSGYVAIGSIETSNLWIRGVRRYSKGD